MTSIWSHTTARRHLSTLLDLLVDLLVVLLVVLLVASLASGCTSLFFQPTRARYDFLDTENLVSKEMTFASDDGTSLAALHFPALDNMLQRPAPIGSIYSAPRALVVQWHDSAENMTSHYRYLSWLPLHGYDLLTFDYRGYGASGGEVDTEGIYRDARAMIRHASRLATEKGIPLIFIGQGLGGSLLLKSLQEVHPKNLRLVVIEGAFYSHRQIAREKLAARWFTWPLQWFAYAAVTDQYRPGGRCLKRLPSGVPTILVYSTKDPVVGIQHGEKLYQDLAEPKEFWRHEDNGHLTGFITKSGKFHDRLLEKLDSVSTPSRGGDDQPDDIEVRQMVNHLIQTESDPVARPADVVETAEVTGPCLDTIHEEVGAKINKR